MPLYTPILIGESSSVIGVIMGLEKDIVRYIHERGVDVLEEWGVGQKSSREPLSKFQHDTWGISKDSRPLVCWSCPSSGLILMYSRSISIAQNIIKQALTVAFESNLSCHDPHADIGLVGLVKKRIWFSQVKIVVKVAMGTTRRVGLSRWRQGTDNSSGRTRSLASVVKLSIERGHLPSMPSMETPMSAPWTCMVIPLWSLALIISVYQQMWT